MATCRRQSAADEAERSAAADGAAFEASKYQPRPLPLPPGMTIASLPGLLRKTSRRDKSGKKTKASSKDPASATVDENGGSEHGEAVRERNAMDPDVDLRIADGEVGCDGDVTLLGDSIANLRLNEAVVGSDEQELFLWQTKTDVDLIQSLRLCLADFDALVTESNALFEECAEESGGCHEEDGSWSCHGESSSTSPQPCPEKRVYARPLKRITQSLINQLGSRAPLVLGRVLTIYNSVLAKDGLTRVTFRAYVASVLTQILRELESRPATSEVLDDSASESDLPSLVNGLAEKVNEWTSMASWTDTWTPRGERLDPRVTTPEPQENDSIAASVRRASLIFSGWMHSEEVRPAVSECAPSGATEISSDQEPKSPDKPAAAEPAEPQEPKLPLGEPALGDAAVLRQEPKSPDKPAARVEGAVGLYLPFQISGVTILQHEDGNCYRYDASGLGNTYPLAYRNSKDVEEDHSTLDLAHGEAVEGTVEYQVVECGEKVKWLKVGKEQ